MNGGLRGAIAAEWTKLWTVRSTWLILALTAVLMGVQALALAASFANGMVPGYGELLPVGDAALVGIQGAQLALIALPLLTITAEFSTGSIRSTLQGVPLRGRLVLAKTVVVVAVTFGAGLLLAVLGAAVGWLTLGEDAVVRLPALAVDLLAVAGYAALVSALALGLGTALRSTAGGLIAIVVLLFVLPNVLPAFGIEVLTRAAEYLPGAAGTHLLGLSTGPYPPTVAVLVLLAWAASALLAGWRLLERRAV